MHKLFRWLKIRNIQHFTELKILLNNTFPMKKNSTSLSLSTYSLRYGQILYSNYKSYTGFYVFMNYSAFLFSSFKFPKSSALLQRQDPYFLLIQIYSGKSTKNHSIGDDYKFLLYHIILHMLQK